MGKICFVRCFHVTSVCEGNFLCLHIHFANQRRSHMNMQQLNQAMNLLWPWTCSLRGLRVGVNRKCTEVRATIQETLQEVPEHKRLTWVAFICAHIYMMRRFKRICTDRNQFSFVSLTEPKTKTAQSPMENVAVINFPSQSELWLHELSWSHVTSQSKFHSNLHTIY